VAILEGPEILLLLSSLATALTIYLSTRKNKKEKTAEDEFDIETIDVEVSSQLPKEIMKKLDTLLDDVIPTNIELINLEKEIKTYVLTRLLEAETEGKISNTDRMLLERKYYLELDHLESPKKAKEMRFQQQEVEVSQKELSTSVEGTVEDIRDSINNVKNNLEILPKESVTKSKKTHADDFPKQDKQPTKIKPTTKSKKSQKNKAEEKIRNIKNEVNKILAEIEQLEIEG
jgi:hypothetical protein